MVVVGSGLLVLEDEHQQCTGNIEDPGDALWWPLVTVTAVGNGDKYPVSEMGRLAAIVVIVVGIALWGVVSSIPAATFVRRLF